MARLPVEMPQTVHPEMLALMYRDQLQARIETLEKALQTIHVVASDWNPTKDTDFVMSIIETVAHNALTDQSHKK